jgi:acetylornithine deacetylase/succinyl-diaminopimelate desuccinylase-like protein
MVPRFGHGHAPAGHIWYGMTMEAVIRYAERNRDKFVSDLAAWVRIPSISDLPEHASDVRRSAQFLADELQRCGADQVEILNTPGHPAVYAEWLHAPSKPTLLIYGHHDVQPVDPLSAWDTPPFEPSLRDGKIFGRGAVDDKGQVLVHAKAIEAFVRTVGRLPINVKMLIEGEEETGSQHLADLLEQHRTRLAADVVCVSDTAMYGRGLPSLCVGLRGLLYFDLVVRGPAHDVHSGTFGGAIANPANALARIIASLHDERGRVAVPGFYDQVRELSPDERATLAELPHDDAVWLQASGAPALFGEPGYTTLERTWTRPTLDVCGLSSGFQGAGSKTIIPALASAKISCRLVADQVPSEIAALFEAHVRQVTPTGVEASVTCLSSALPYVAAFDHPAFGCATRAFQRAFGKPTIFMREGGTIPFVRTIADSTGKPCVLMGFGQPDENTHGPNEWMLLENFDLGIKSAAYFYDELARLDG